MRRALTLFAVSLFFSVSGFSQQQIAALHPQNALVWQRTSPSPSHPDGPVLYQLLFSASGTPGTVPIFDANPRHLSNSPITVSNGVVTIGGSNGLVIDSAGSILTFAGVSLTGGTGGLTVVSHDSTLAGSGTAGLPLGIAAGGVTTVQISSGNATLGQFLAANGSGGASWQSLALPASGWNLTGNAGTNCTTSPCATFLGTTDSSAFEIDVTGNRALRIEPVTDGQIGFGFSPNVIAGFSGNLVFGAGTAGATIAGGGAQGLPGEFLANTVGASFATVGGGYNNHAGGIGSVVAGGGGNSAAGANSFTVVGGGEGNFSNGLTATIGGGSVNSALGDYTVVPGGLCNIASGNRSLAAGTLASSNQHEGTFVWADASTFATINGPCSSGSYLSATADNQFLARATGGFNFIAGIDGSGNPDPLKTLTISPNSGVVNFVPAQTFLGTSIASGAATSGQVLTANGSGGASWTNAPGTGTITGVTATAPLTGGGTSGTVTLGIANQGVTTVQIGSGAATNGQVLAANGSGGTTWATFSGTGLPAWSLTGNAGTVDGANFLGTVDNIPLNLSVNSSRAFRIEPATDAQDTTLYSPNIIAGFSGNVVTPDGSSRATAGATIAGGGASGNVNTVSASFATIGGGFHNAVASIGGTVAGGVRNNANGGFNATVGGGSDNNATNGAATVGGGNLNHADGAASTVAGGQENIANGDNSTVGGGQANTSSGQLSIVAGGSGNMATDLEDTISGGVSNFASHAQSTIGGGNSNGATGDFSTVPGGLINSASGRGSFAAGQYTTDFDGVNHYNGVFLWGDNSTSSFSGMLTASHDNQFLARATGGVTFITAVDGTGAATAGVQVSAGGGSWSSLSDRNVKEHFAELDREQLLNQVLALPITTWNYKSQDARVRHLGPMAQDFYASFQLGEDDRHITTIDEGGVALAAIQALNQKLESELKQKDEQISALAAALAAQSAQLKTLQKEFAALPAQPIQSGRGNR